jgi:hypothetical protein
MTTHDTTAIEEILRASYSLSDQIHAELDQQYGEAGTSTEWRELYAIAQGVGSVITQLQTIQARDKA